MNIYYVILFFITTIIKFTEKVYYKYFEVIIMTKFHINLFTI
jgi:hypothetical protein